MADIGNPDDVARIRALIEDRMRAVHSKDSSMLMPNIAPDIVSFDVTDPLHSDGAEALREGSEAWFASYRGPIGYEVQDVQITAGEDVAFCHFFYHVTGTLTDGSDVRMWVRATACFRNVDGNWIATHMHESVPFDPETGKASLDLKP